MFATAIPFAGVQDFISSKLVRGDSMVYIAKFPFGGMSILIIVGVALETVKQIDSQLMIRNYEGFLR